MNFKTFVLVTALSGFTMGCNQSHQETANQDNHIKAESILSDASPDRLRAHLRFLADDLLEGRDTGSAGHEIASLYISAEFEKYGLKPAGDNGTYIQRVSFRQAFLDQSSPELVLTGSEGSLPLEYPNDYLTFADPVYLNSDVEGQLVFAGYGIVAPELSHDDYTDIDVEGKVVVVLSGKPASFPSEEGAHFGSTNQKLTHATNNGAIGFITISTPTAEKVRPYQNMLSYIHTPSVRWLNEQGQPANVFPQIKNTAYFSKHAAEKVFNGAKESLEEIYAKLEKDESPTGFDLPYRISLTKKSEHNVITSPNVAAMLEGTDPIMKDEYVVYSAHSDHIGISKTVKKDKINNGAMDNATGTSVLLETARIFAEQDSKPKRSILFVAVTGEEKGLLGADYFARNPTVPVGSMVANVNLDMPILTYEFADVIAFGANHSDMQASVEKAANKVGIELSPDPWPEQALFTRSDHYSFVKQGVPAVFLVPGLKSADENVDASKKFGEFISTHYHKPSDDFNQPFNWKAATKFTEVNFQIGQTLANQQNRPRWNDGDFFGKTFGQLKRN